MAPPKCGFQPDDYKSHDIAILELEKEVEPSNGKSSVAVGPICLPEAGEVKSHFSKFYSYEFSLMHCGFQVELAFELQDFYGITGTALGWGKGEGGITTGKLGSQK